MHFRALLLALISILPVDAFGWGTTGNNEMVVCLANGTLNVRSDNLNEILFAVENLEPLKIFQGWGSGRKKKEIDGASYTFVKVQFTRREQQGEDSVGWVAENHIKARSQCSGPSEETGPEEEERPRWGQRPSTPRREPEEEERGGGEIRGLNDSRCCQFPTKGEPTDDFDSGMRRFGANRDSGGRLHGACDIYRFDGEQILSVAPGVVIRERYAFYQGTYAIEVRHSGGFIVRYGEINGREAAATSGGEKVKMGQTIAYMGKVNSDCCEPMLHFELYSGTASGSLSNGSGPYNRRSDLLNPTQYLKRWQR